jgi:hypothetical protein
MTLSLSSWLKFFDILSKTSEKDIVLNIKVVNLYKNMFVLFKNNPNNDFESLELINEGIKFCDDCIRCCEDEIIFRHEKQLKVDNPLFTRDKK